jgi:TatD DNase family protein
MFIDTHAHLNFEKFAKDYPAVIKRAFDANVKGIINVGSNLKTSKKAVGIANEYSNGVYAAIGLHPIHIKEEEFDENAFEKIAQNKKVVAIGETGLDYYYDKGTAPQQKELFRKHINFAQKISKPLILHSRDAGEDVLTFLMESRHDIRGVMHCYQEDWSFAKVILDMGLYLSFTGVITFSKNEKTFEAIREAPLERILIETDCPYMTPEPYRGKRNEPAYVIEVAKKIAELKKISLEEVAEQTSKNAIKLFGLDL